MSSFRPPRLRLSEEKRALLARLLAEQGHHVSHAERIPRRAGGTSAPLSFAQQRLWFLDQWSPGRATYNSGGVLRLSGPLNVCALAQAVAEIARRHESLRTVFSLADELPVQTVNPPAPPSLPLADLARLKARELQTQEERLTAAESRRPFELAAGPLLRVWLLRLAADEHVCLLVMHHIVSDGWSVGVLMRELSALYDSFRAGLPSPLAELPIQYADYAAWQRERLSGELLAPSLDFWRRQLNPPPVPLELPTARPRPPVQTFEGARRAFDLGPELTCALKELARAEEATPFMVLLAAFQTLLYRYTGQEDVCVGTPVAGRRQLETEPLIGCFVNTLVMRTSLGGDPSFTELLARVRQTSLAAFAHAELPYERLVEELQPQRDTSRNPLFQVMLVLQNTPPPEFNLAGLRVTPRDLDSGASRFDLTLFLTETGGQLRCALEYNSDLFDAPFIARLTGHFEHLLAAATADRTVPVSALSLLTSAERHQLVREWNDTAAPDPTPLLHLLLARLRSAPDAIALVRGDDHLSLSALHARARALARRLRAAGTGPDSLVALCLSRSPAMVEALLGVLYSGAAYLPLDPEHPAERLALVLSDARPSVLVTERGLRPLVAACGATADGAAVIELDAEPEGEHDAHVPDAHTPAASLAFDSARSLAYVIYTSGTTGRPKGVEVERRSLDLFLASMAVRPGLCSADVLLAVTTLSFDIAGLELWLPLREGARLELATEPEARDGARLAALLRERRVSVLQATPSTWRLLAQEWAGVSGAAATGGVSGAAAGLRALCGGEAWSSALAEALLAAGCAQVWNVYGPTETTIWSAARRVRRGERVVAAGGPLMRTQLYVLDGRGEVAPEGAWGQLWIGGGGLARGYRGRAELTAERFRPDGLSGECGGRVYQTGDVARVPGAGVVEVGGRGDEQVKVRGYRVELGEVEAALVRHGAVREGAAVVRAGVGGEMELVGYVVWAAGAGGGVGEGVGACGGVGATAVELREHMRVLVPEYMVPGRYVAVRELPLTPNGKLDRRALAAMTEVEPVAAGEYVAPRNYVEGELAKIWGGLLQAERVGREDDFFGLGGHSLLAAQMLSRVRSTFQVELTMTELFRSPKLASVAREITWRQAEQVGFETLSRLVAEIGQLTAEEAGAMLAAEA